jgi:hypothetical protein
MEPFDEQRSLLLRELRELLRDPNARIGAVDEAYLRLEGEQLWTEALQRYQEQGRGAMMVDMRDTAGGNIDVYYLPQALLLADLTPADAALGKALAAYDPSQEALIVIWHRHGSTFYRLGEKPPQG